MAHTLGPRYRSLPGFQVFYFIFSLQEKAQKMEVQYIYIKIIAAFLKKGNRKVYQWLQCSWKQEILRWLAPIKIGMSTLTKKLIKLTYFRDKYSMVVSKTNWKILFASKLLRIWYIFYLTLTLEKALHQICKIKCILPNPEAYVGLVKS